MFFEKIKIEYRALLSFSFYVFWLISFPMNGFLIGKDINTNIINYFLLSHISTFIVISFFLNFNRLIKISNTGILVTAFLTFFFPFLDAYKNTMIFIIGITSVFPAIKSVLMFKNVSKKIEFSALSLIVGNFLTFLLTITSLNNLTGFSIIALCLITIAFIPFEKDYEHKSLEVKIIQLFVVFVFYFTGGLMYDFFLPNYIFNSYLSNFELIFYILGVFIAIYFLRKDLEMTFAIGILFSSLSFFLYKIQVTFFINIGMYISQISFGIVDAFFLNLLIFYIQDIKKLLLIFATMLSGIFTGKILCLAINNKIGIVIESGNLFLIVSAILLYFSNRIKIPEKMENNELKLQQDLEKNFLEENQIYKKLSEQEKKVLEMVLENKSYNIIAEEMKISVSTVKTYMKRIFEKTNTKNKEELIRTIKKE